MRTFYHLHYAVVALGLLMPAAAQAAGALPIPDAGFDWNRFYAGIAAVGQASTSGFDYGAAARIGLDARLEVALAGAELAATGLTGASGTTVDLQATGRLGLMMTDNVALYGVGGAGLNLSTGNTRILAGAGVEAALTDSVTVDGRYLHGGSLTGGPDTQQFTIGTNFHF